MKNKVISVALTEETLDALRAAAEADRRTVSQWVRLLIEAALTDGKTGG